MLKKFNIQLTYQTSLHHTSRKPFIWIRSYTYNDNVESVKNKLKKKRVGQQVTQQEFYH